MNDLSMDAGAQMALLVFVAVAGLLFLLCQHLSYRKADRIRAAKEARRSEQSDEGQA